MSKKHKAGFVSIIGNPNVGKSTFLNSWVGEDASIVTPKSQTTRHRIRFIINSEDYQIVLSDTPGLIEPKYQLQNSMMKFLKDTLIDSDILLLMTTVGDKIKENDHFINKIKNIKKKIFLLINKIDLTNQQTLENEVNLWEVKLPGIKIFPISALNNFNVENVSKLILKNLPFSPAFFPKDQFADKSKRFFVNEFIREQIFLKFNKEVPYSTEVVTEVFDRSKENVIKIESTIIVERETQKGILIGKNGLALKKVGTDARKKLESFFKIKVHLKLFVKVNKKWRTNPKKLKLLGYN
ncbi:MAG: GTPase Era [Flavobacteriales bacterium]|nr:MAG: GTPase Era [Flavobacteriales bacterium TMED96]RZP10938.1 MAG: GTPase Era [Flavobacteriales bacterium]|tara:strand:- start:13169 stop:14056 length:888 start_codon:yes stop_codon:yes gene_type:complete